MFAPGLGASLRVELTSAERSGRLVLPRIGAAVAQFISPIDSSPAKKRAPRRDSKESGQEGFKRAQPEKADAKKVPEAEAEPRATERQAPPRVIKKDPSPPIAGAPPSTLPGASVAGAFLELFHFIQMKKHFFLQLFGHHSYREALREQKKAGRFRRGTMLDRKAG